MTRLTLTSALLGVGAAIILATPVRADIVATTPVYTSPAFDFVTTFPPAGATIIGTYTFTAFTAADLDTITSITISGTFGNGNSPTTALSDYFLGIPGGNETAVPVANCDDFLAPCASSDSGPTTWSTPLTQAQITALAPALEAGSINFTYTWDTPVLIGLDQIVYAGATTLDITTTPEPSTVVFCLSGLAGVVLFRRRFRKV